jgi:hypothetical protein
VVVSLCGGHLLGCRLFVAFVLIRFEVLALELMNLIPVGGVRDVEVKHRPDESEAAGLAWDRPMTLVRRLTSPSDRSSRFVDRMKGGRCCPCRATVSAAGGVRGGEYGAAVRDGGVRKQTWSGRPFLFDGLRARVCGWPPLRLARVRCERGSVGVVLPACCFTDPINGEGGEGSDQEVRRLDVHREFAQVAIWQDGLVRQAGQIAATPGGAEAVRR